MNRVKVDISEDTLINDEDQGIMGVIACCTRCGHMTESFGTEENSRIRCLALMREECPKGQKNWYVESDETEE